MAWALAHRERFPVDLNRAPKELLLPSDDLFAVSVDDASADSTEIFCASPLSHNTDARVRVQPSFISLCESVILHQDPERFARLYRLFWRMHEDSRVRSDPLDADWLHAQHMAQAVRRDQPRSHRRAC
jgi:hypothetical protein